MKVTQNQRIMNHLTKFKTLSEAQATKNYNIKCLSKRISELRKDGKRISTTKNSRGATAYALTA